MGRFLKIFSARGKGGKERQGRRQTGAGGTSTRPERSQRGGGESQGDVIERVAGGEEGEASIKAVMDTRDLNKRSKGGGGTRRSP